MTSSVGRGTRFDVSLDNTSLPAVVARHGPQAVLSVPGLAPGTHRLRVRAHAGGQTSEPVAAAFQVLEPSIDTHLVGGPVRDYVLLVLDASVQEASYYEYVVDDGTDWVVHRDRALLIGPLPAGEHRVRVRAVAASGSKDPVPARFRWAVAAPRSGRASSRPPTPRPPTWGCT